MCSRVLSVFICLLSLFYSIAIIANTSPPRNTPVKVKVGLFVNNIVNISEKYETIEFNGTLVLQWRDPRLVSKFLQKKETQIYSNSAASSMLDKIWQPQLVFVEYTNEPKFYATHLVINEDGTVTLARRLYAVVKSVFDFHNFPFDSQLLNIQIRPFRYGANTVELINWPNYSGISKNAHLEDWRITKVDSSVRNIKDELNHQMVSEYVLSVHYQRNWAFYAFEVFLPIFFIVLLSFSVFWMTHNPLVNRVAISLTAILTIVVFQWRVLGNLPQVSYHTFLDLAMHYSLYVVGFALLASVAVEKIEKTKPKAERLCQILFPLAYVLGLLAIYFFWLD